MWQKLTRLLKRKDKKEVAPEIKIPLDPEQYKIFKEGDLYIVRMAGKNVHWAKDFESALSFFKKNIAVYYEDEVLGKKHERR